ncbi:uncharacterized protein PpBr36_09735 [Pyricularia pennisetigena]|uniref:uncharacterized protein n=1 Tax=Pyricularia pennisetigena TaxID=1578925 RepID=UPI00114E2DF2|nr:uncharacterized protein PpBr36_09735 [Pyricularia pennisetigena]TLS22165.1 hypothetical protein PpBr36_09735 [Pyricularia pennisetigena]
MASAGMRNMASMLSFVTHAPPDITKVPHIVGLSTTPLQFAGPEKMGFFFTEFLKWKMVFHGLGSPDHQAWYSLFEPQEAMVMHNCTYGMDSVSIDKRESILSRIRVSSNTAFLVKAFVEELDKQAESAAAHDGCLIVVVSGEMSPELNICLNLDGCSSYLRKSSWFDHLPKKYGIPITVMTPSFFSTGWTMNPFLGQIKPELTSPEAMEIMLAQSCGGAFTEAIIKALVSMSQFQGSVIEAANVTGKDFFVPFYNAIHGSLMNRTPEESAATGEQHRWEDLKTPAKPTPADSTPTSGYMFLKGAFGGSKESQLRHIQFLAQQELRSYPGDWDQPGNREARSTLLTLLQSLNPQEDRVRETFTLIEWRCSMNFVADAALLYLNIPQPQEESCRNWNWEVQQYDDTTTKNYGRLRSELFGQLTEFWPKNPLPVGIQRNSFRDNLYWRPLQYLSAAICKNVFDPSDFNKAVAAGFEAMEKLKAFVTRMAQLQLLMIRNENSMVMNLGQAWANCALGQDVRTSTGTVPALPISIAQATMDGAVLDISMVTERKTTVPSGPVLAAAQKPAVVTEAAAANSFQQQQTNDAADISVRLQANPRLLEKVRQLLASQDEASDGKVAVPVGCAANSTISIGASPGAKAALPPWPVSPELVLGSVPPLQHDKATSPQMRAVFERKRMLEQMDERAQEEDSKLKEARKAQMGAKWSAKNCW